MPHKPDWSDCTDADESDWHADLRRVADYWRRIRPGPGLLPGRQHFDPAALAPMLHRVWLIDVTYAPLRFRFRVIGTSVTPDHGIFTGRFIDEVTPGFGPGEGAFERLRFSVDTRRGTWRRGQALWRDQKLPKRIENLTLPMARDGVTVDMMLCCTVLKDLTEA